MDGISRHHTLLAYAQEFASIAIAIHGPMEFWNFCIS